MTPEPQASLQEQASFFLQKYLENLLGFKSKCTGLAEFQPLPDDIFIATVGKSGTTLLQQLVYQLKVVTGNVPTDPNGNDFEDISAVVPFVEAGPLTVRESVHRYTPRAFKTHSTPDGSAYGSKLGTKVGSIIYCIRDPLQSGPSFLDFTLDWFLEGQVQGQELREEVYYQYFMTFCLGLERMPDGTFKRDGKKCGKWFAHVKSWLEAEGDNIMYLLYEDIIRDIPGTVQNIADFLSISVTPEDVATVVARCDRDFMVKDPRFRDVLVARGMGWSEDGGLRVRPKDSQGFKQMKIPEDCLAIHKKMLQDTFGVSDYNEVADILREKEARRQSRTS